MVFRVLEMSLAVAGRVAPALEGLRRVDSGLADQVERALCSIALNIAEGNGLAGRARRNSFRIARGSAEEVRAGLRLAVVLRRLESESVAEPLEELDGIVAMLHGLIR